MSSMLWRAASASALMLAAGSPAFAQSGPFGAGSTDDEIATAAAIAEAPDAPPGRDTIVVTGDSVAVEQRPATTESKSAEEIQITTSVTNAEDALRYFPNLLVRKRHIGDTQAPVATRTNGVGASARSLIYADGVLLSALIGNNNSSASPKWGMVSPEEIASVDVSYGPFSAAYAGNSIGAVIEIATRMPEKLEGSLGVSGSRQHFEQYGQSDDFGAWQASGVVGDRIGPFAFWLSATHTDSRSQPLAYVTATQPACTATSTAGCAQAANPVFTGAITDSNRAGLPIVVLGAGGYEGQVQDNLKFKAAWEIAPGTTLAYTIGRFGNDTHSDVRSFLRDAAGNEVFAGGPATINGFRYTIQPSSFSNNFYNFDETQWMHALSLQHDGNEFDWRVTASLYDYDQSEQRLPSGALPAAHTGGAGSIARMDGTGWSTIDAKGVWRPAGSAHEVSFGAHGDRYELTNERFATANWLSGPTGALQSVSRGKTQTGALWAQDAWSFAPAFRLITGARLESWKAYDGFNFSASPALNTVQPERSADKVSPKVSLEWDFAPQWLARASVGQAYRFPTVSELYQAVSTGPVLSVPDPTLRPEDALSTEWSIERRLADGNVRLTLFTEDIKDALISQSGLLNGSTVNFIQNVDKVESRGVEVVASKENVLVSGLSLSGNVTYVDSKTAKDRGFAAAVGKLTPQVPKWRATLVATYRPDDKWAFTLAGRYQDRVYGTIDNLDSVSHTFQGFEGFMTWDARATYAIDTHWSAAVGIENFADADYFLFHPFPQRTATAELTYRF